MLGNSTRIIDKLYTNQAEPSIEAVPSITYSNIYCPDVISPEFFQDGNVAAVEKRLLGVHSALMSKQLESNELMQQKE